MSTMHSQGLHQVETPEDIKKHLQQNGMNLKDISSSVDYGALHTLKTWVNQEGKEFELDWDNFQECVTFMFEDYCRASREIHSKLVECEELKLRHHKERAYHQQYYKLGGNPEPQYNDTRHNVGHRVMDQLIQIYWKDHLYQKGNYYFSRKYPNIILFKSDSTLMNLQGKTVYKNFQQFHKQSSLIVLHDDLERDLGKFQFRKAGTSSRGHNGLKSIDGVYKNKYSKIAVGIGRPSSKSVTNYVLSKFDDKEKEVLDFEVIPNIAKELENIIEADLDRQRDKKVNGS
ncbi:hypothetical protein KGF57_002787 [Candida theae]|uniref:Peptidyl-tRNA hydrolase n=1 Tax=Candida theae TaxID=1198502 RepID=A0AAD5BEM4_9ASCO|nr:uncharacterized protein KGF57_002787 [Candida theae]KAI5957979.1 hypothetical protein KGF57_002787 [Candida theae]